MTIKQKVEYCLKNFLETRNSDAILTFKVIYQFHSSQIRLIDGKWWISTDILKDIKEDVVKRYRAQFNQKGLYLPTSQQVLNVRGLKEIEWRNYMSPSNPARG
jgi:hypothetical protein